MSNRFLSILFVTALFTQSAHAGFWDDIQAALQRIRDTVAGAQAPDQRARELLEQMRVQLEQLRIATTEEAGGVAWAELERLRDEHAAHLARFGVREGAGTEESDRIERDAVYSVSRWTPRNSEPLVMPAANDDFGGFGGGDFGTTPASTQELLARIEQLVGALARANQGAESEVGQRLSGRLFRQDGGDLLQGVQTRLATMAQRMAIVIEVYSWVNGAWKLIFRTGTGSRVLRVYMSTPIAGKSFSTGFKWDDDHEPPPPPLGGASGDGDPTGGRRAVQRRPRDAQAASAGSNSPNSHNRAPVRAVMMAIGAVPCFAGVVNYAKESSYDTSNKAIRYFQNQYGRASH